MKYLPAHCHRLPGSRGKLAGRATSEHTGTLVYIINFYLFILSKRSHYLNTLRYVDWVIFRERKKAEQLHKTIICAAGWCSRCTVCWCWLQIMGLVWSLLLQPHLGRPLHSGPPQRLGHRDTHWHAYIHMRVHSCTDDLTLLLLLLTLLHTLDFELE